MLIKITDDAVFVAGFSVCVKKYFNDLFTLKIISIFYEAYQSVQCAVQLLK